MQTLLKWNIYEVTSENIPINGVMLRGRIRKLCLENNQNVLVENTQDIDKSVRFAVLSEESPTSIISYLKNILPDINIALVLENIENPILSKLKVNKEERYKI